jgi:hypothetical protein
VSCYDSLIHSPFARLRFVRRSIAGFESGELRRRPTRISISFANINNNGANKPWVKFMDKKSFHFYALFS